VREWNSNKVFKIFFTFHY